MSATANIKAALRRRYCAPEWAVLFEVGDATGARHTRFADAVAMSLWPSRGLTLHGFEIKISKSDWKKERSQPQKAETIAAYCDFWTLVTAKGVISDTDEIPPAWGWIEWDGAKLTRRRDDTKTEAQPMDRAFLAALLRRADKSNEELINAEVIRRTATADSDFDRRVEEAAARQAGRQSNAAKQIEEFEKASGIKFGHWYGQGSPEEVGRAVKAVLHSGIDGTYQGMMDAAERLRDMSDRIEKSMFDQGFDPKKKGRAR